MLGSTAAHAELRRFSNVALGSVYSASALTLPEVLDLFQGQIAVSGNNRFSLDLPLEGLQQARLGDAERSYDRFVRQFVAYAEFAGCVSIQTGR